MIEIRPKIHWTDETEALVLRALALDPLCSIERERDAVLNGQATLFGVLKDAKLAAVFVGCVSLSERGDEFCVGAAAAVDETARVSLEAIAGLDGLARAAQCRAVRAELYNPRYFPVFRRAGYKPLRVTMRKEL